jgi:histidinol-phosphate aminotransferase
MRLSRRAFVQTLGLSGVGVISGAVVAARGREDLVGLGRLESGWIGLDAPPASTLIRISSNENPNGPGPRAIEAIKAAFDDANRYPYDWGGKIAKAIADDLGLAEENILTGCGSGEILRISTLAFTSPTRALVTAAPSFEEPERTATNFGHAVRAVPVTKDLALEPAMARRRRCRYCSSAARTTRPAPYTAPMPSTTSFAPSIERPNHHPHGRGVSR